METPPPNVARTECVVAAAAERAEDEIVVARRYRDVANGDRRQPGNLRPVLAGVGAPVRGELGDGEEEGGGDMGLRDGVGRAALGQIADDRLPGSSAVGALQQVRLEVAVLVVFGGDIYGGRVAVCCSDARGA